EVCKEIQRGFAAPYKLELDYFRGRVDHLNPFVSPKTHLKARVSPIRAILGSEDEYCGLQHGGLPAYGRIRLSYGHVLEAATQVDAVAGTLVQDMSHRTATTEDVLYKKDSFAKLGSADDLQEKVIIPGRDKPMKPMTGVTGPTMEWIANEQYLENADSYA